MPFPRASKALSRFTVLDLTSARRSHRARQLADWGANVLKIEEPGGAGRRRRRASNAMAPIFRICSATGAASR